MSNGAPEPPYSLDTSSLMEWQARYYPLDVFPSVAAKVAELIRAGRFLAAGLVHEEIQAVGTAELINWANENAAMFIPTPEILAEALSIQNQFAGLRDPRAEFEEADAYVIALARMRRGIVVTQETPAAEKRNPKRTHFIPDVCRELGIPSISLLDDEFRARLLPKRLSRRRHGDDFQQPQTRTHDAHSVRPPST